MTPDPVEWHIADAVGDIEMYGEWVREYETRSWRSVDRILGVFLHYWMIFFIVFSLSFCVWDLVQHKWWYGLFMGVLAAVNCNTFRSARKTKRQEKERIEGYRLKMAAAYDKLAIVDPGHPLLPLVIEEEL